MNLHLYATQYRTPLPDTVFSALLSRLPSGWRDKIMRFRNWEDRHAALLGKLLLRLALQNAGYEPDWGRLRYTAEQKPFLPDGPAFNLSHSGHRVVCLLGGRDPLGIDIESLSPLSFEDFEPHFTTGEWAVIRHAASPLQAFYRFWTAKESILKADGRGLAIPLQSINLSRSTIVPLDGITWTVHELPLFDDYACHYCTVYSEPPPTIDLHELSREQWIADQ